MNFLRVSPEGHTAPAADAGVGKMPISPVPMLFREWFKNIYMHISRRLCKRSNDFSVKFSAISVVRVQKRS